MTYRNNYNDDYYDNINGSTDNDINNNCKNNTCKKAMRTVNGNKNIIIFSIALLSVYFNF